MEKYDWVKRLSCWQKHPYSFPPNQPGCLLYVEKLQEVYEKAIQAGAASIKKAMQKGYGFTCGFSDLFGNDWWPTEV
jgi:uncharacterized glyoxalase superfamily protein PhnB